MKILLSEEDSTSNEFLNNKIVKVQAGNCDEWVWDNLHRFDKVIFLLRNNIKDVFESVSNANRWGWDIKYNPTEDINYSTSEGITRPVSSTTLRAHETGRNLVCRLLLEKKKKKKKKTDTKQV